MVKVALRTITNIMQSGVETTTLKNLFREKCAAFVEVVIGLVLKMMEIKEMKEILRKKVKMEISTVPVLVKVMTLLAGWDVTNVLNLSLEMKKRKKRNKRKKVEMMKPMNKTE